MVTNQLVAFASILLSSLISTAAAADTIPPDLKITSPTAYAYLATRMVTVTGTATDALAGASGISSVIVNGVTATGGTAVGAGVATWSARVLLAFGVNTIEAIAWDNSGNQIPTHAFVTVQRLVSGDMDRNGFGDILLHENGRGAPLSWLYQYADSLDAFTIYIANVASDWRIRATADLNGDGHLDLIWQHPDGTVVVWYMHGQYGLNCLAQKQLAGSTPDWKLVGVADLDGDGHPDLIWQHTNGVVAAWYMGGSDGSIYLGAKQLAGETVIWRVAGVADLDDNGNADLVWQSTDGTVVAWYMGGSDGSVYQSAKVLAGDAPSWRLAALGDLNGDGKIDLIWQHNVSTFVVAWYMGGSDGSTLLRDKLIDWYHPELTVDVM